jgi:hypothetical protein
VKLRELFSYGPLVRLEQLWFAIDREIRWPRRKRRVPREADISSYEVRVYSQHGEDGILEELFRRLDVSQGYFVEFGIGDGKECNCAKLAREDGWSGLMLESDLRDHAAASRRFEDNSAVAVRQAFVSTENIEQIFLAAGVPRELDLLSIDIDGNDYWLWRSLALYRPKIVVIETNPFFEPPQKWVLPYDAAFCWKGDWRFGASLAALEALGRELGYALLGTDGSATNAFFVRDDLLEKVAFLRASSEDAYAKAQKFTHFSRSKAGMPFRNGYP